MSRICRLLSVHAVASVLVFLHLCLSRPGRADEQPAAGAGDLGNLPADALVMRPQMLVDPYLDMNAFSVLVPDKWKLSGEFAWVPGIPQPSIGLVVVDPVQRAGWRAFPQLSYMAGRREAEIAANPGNKAALEKIFADGAQGPGFEIRKLPVSPREYVLTVLVPRFCPDVAAATDVEVVSEGDLPDLAKALAERDPNHPQVRSSRIRITFTRPDGPQEAEFVATLFATRIPNSSTTSWCASTAVCAAPRGKLDALLPTLNAIGSSATLQLPWYNCRVQVGWQVVQQHLQLGFENIRNDQERLARRMEVLHGLARQASAEVSDKIRGDFAAQQQAKAEAHEQFMHYVNNTASFRNPNGGPNVTLPGGYQFQYANSAGQYIQTNVAGYNPPPGWQQVQPVK